VVLGLVSGVTDNSNSAVADVAGVGVNSPALGSRRNLQTMQKPIIFSHSGFVTPEDIQALRKDNNYICITPENEMCEGHGHPSSSVVHDHATLGMDTNWNISGDMVHNARLWLQHVRTTNYQKVLDQGKTPRQNPMSVTDAFELLTVQGAQALRRDDIGVLRVGAKADIVCFDGESPNMVGWTNAVAAVILHSNIGDIKHVLVDGAFRKRSGQLVTKTLSWEEVRMQFKDVAHQIQKENSLPPPIPDQFWGGGEYGSVEMASVRQQVEGP
jgi:cytosine/adenosine deaminase-related metal-dependent hydrolase